MSKYINMPDMAEEDFEILVAITTDLTQRLGTFRINLPNKAYVGNGEEPNMERFTFAGMDAILETKSKLASQMPLEEFESLVLIMPTNSGVKQLKVGSLFEMDVYISSECPKDRFIIRVPEKGLDI